MTASSRPKNRRLIAYLIATGILGCWATVGLVIAPRVAGSLKQATPRDQWERTALREYQMTLEVNGLQRCTAAYVVRDDRIIHLVTMFPTGNPCDTMLYTVNELFDQIDKTNTTRQCGPN